MCGIDDEQHEANADTEHDGANQNLDGRRCHPVRPPHVHRRERGSGTRACLVLVRPDVAFLVPQLACSLQRSWLLPTQNRPGSPSRILSLLLSVPLKIKGRSGCGLVSGESAKNDPRWTTGIGLESSPNSEMRRTEGAPARCRNPFLSNPPCWIHPLSATADQRQRLCGSD